MNARITKNDRKCGSCGEAILRGSLYIDLRAYHKGGAVLCIACFKKEKKK